MENIQVKKEEVNLEDLFNFMFMGVCPVFEDREKEVLEYIYDNQLCVVSELKGQEYLDVEKSIKENLPEEMKEVKIKKMYYVITYRKNQHVC